MCNIEERQIAEIILDFFRKADCRASEIVMINTILFSPEITSLNPKEKDLFDTVFVGLQVTGYFEKEDDPRCIRLTQKGFDYIYDEEQKDKMLGAPWLFPSINNVDWDRAYNRLWRIIGPQESALYYMSGPKFYDLVSSLTDDLPPSYMKYMDLLRKKGLSTSRVDYYKYLIDGLDEQLRYLIYGKVQSYIESIIASRNEEEDKDFSDLDFPFTENDDLINEKEEKTVPPSAALPILNSSPTSTSKPPKVAISYSWDDEQHKKWVLKLATDLRALGIDIILDVWDGMKLGKFLPHFMAHAVKDSDRVICVMTPNYKKKTDDLEGGVGVEYSIISAEIKENVKTEKFIPLFRKGNEDDIPTFLLGRSYVDMRDDSTYEEAVEALARDIWNEPKYKKPLIGAKPKFD